MNNIKHSAIAGLLALGLAASWNVQAQPSARAQEVRAQLDKARKDSATAKAELAAQRNWLQKKSLPAVALQRHNAHEAEFNKRSAEFERAAAAWQADPSDAKLRELEPALQSVGKGNAGKVPASLPWGAPKNNKRMPAETKAAWYRNLHQESGIQLAQAGLTTIGGVRFSAVPSASEAPQDADLAETADVQLTPAIRAKAQELGSSPVNIANWVRANVQYAPTWGVIQGSDATLRSLRGNAIDISTLTVALLRASGIPARYQFGTVDVPAAMAMNWLGGLAQPEAALDLLLQGGIAARGLSEAGQIKTIRMEHAWVSAYVYWSPTRGARAGGAALQPPQHPSPNAALNAWVPIDAAFKQFDYTPGNNLQEVAAFNAAAVLDAGKQGATCTAESAARVNHGALSAHYGQFRASAQQQLGSLGADTRVGQVLGTAVLTGTQQPLLPGVLAFPTVIAATPTAVLNSALRWRASLQLVQGTNNIVALDKPLAELEGQPVALGFTPETQADADILAALLRPEAGGDASTGLPPRIAAYLVKVKAQLRVNGQVAAEGGSFMLGESLTLRTQLQNPEGNAGIAEATITAGETHVWNLQGQALAAAAPAVVSQRLAALRAQLNQAPLPSGANQATDLLYGVASSYQASLDAKSRLYQRVAGTVEARLPSAVRASSRVETEEAFGLILNVRPAGVGLHADRLGSAVASRSGLTAAGYSRQSLERASAEAHHLLNRLFGPAGNPAQSALSGLAFAAAQGQTVWRADAATLAQVLAALDAQSTVRAQIEQGVANGMQALAAQTSVDLGGLPMDPLVLNDSQAGTAAYSVASRNLPVIQLTAQRPGSIGWLGLADAQASKMLVAPAIDAAIGQLNTSQALLGDIDNALWSGFAGQGDVLDGIYQSRISEAATTANACDWLISLLGTQLGAGLPASGNVNRAPIITSTPVTSAQAEATYSYTVTAVDDNNDALTFSLVAPPTGMTINAAGQITWPAWRSPTRVTRSRSVQREA
jgi:transglutaminase-like putative cysteine protease